MQARGLARRAGGPLQGQALQPPPRGGGGGGARARALRQRCSGSHRYSVILSTRMQPMVRTASARMSGLGSCESCGGAGGGGGGGGGGRRAAGGWAGPGRQRRRRGAGRSAARQAGAYGCRRAGGAQRGSKRGRLRAGQRAQQRRSSGAAATRLDERVDGHDRQVGLRLGVVDEVQVDQLLQLQVLRLHVVHDRGEEHGDVLAHGHGRDHLLHGLLLLGPVQAGQLLLELMDLAWGRGWRGPGGHARAGPRPAPAAPPARTPAPPPLHPSPLLVVLKYLPSAMAAAGGPPIGRTGPRSPISSLQILLSPCNRGGAFLLGWAGGWGQGVGGGAARTRHPPPGAVVPHAAPLRPCARRTRQARACAANPQCWLATAHPEFGVVWRG